MYWELSTPYNGSVGALLRTHQQMYSRKIEPFPRGESLVLIGSCLDALFIMHRPRPVERYTWRSGFDYWTVTAFRNESPLRASDLVRQGLAAALYLWGDVLPLDGVRTLVDIEHLRPIYRRGAVQYGMCYQRVGFAPEGDDKRFLRRLTLSREALVQIEPTAPLKLVEQMSLL